ncbi:hypothetical protein CHUAL_012641 [Chamberlinius hualienensis]
MFSKTLNWFTIVIALNIHQIASQNCKNYIDQFNCQQQDGFLTVQYGQHSVECNENLPLSTYADQPIVTYNKALQDQKYILMMVDPDAPSSKGGYFLHWLVTNINGEDFSKGNLQNSKTSVSYAPPAPPKGSGTHRYQFFVFQQQENEVFNNITRRANFKMVQFFDNRNFCTTASIQFRTQASRN